MAGPSSAIISETITYTIDVTNNGSVNQTSVNVNTSLPVTVTKGSAVASNGSLCLNVIGGGPGTTLICPLGTLTPGATVYITVTAVPTATGPVTSSSSVDGLVDDPDLSNNDAQVTTIVSSSFGFLPELKILVNRAAPVDEFG
jgi:uncharacterized repeat protein (TIGR01451 family)